MERFGDRAIKITNDHPLDGTSRTAEGVRSMSPCSCCPMRDRCDHRSAPEEIRREVCSWFELAERYGIKCCGSCDWYQCDVDKPICQNYLTTKKPDGFCDEWEERT